MAFDPFNDFDTAGYLRNRVGAKDPQVIRKFEHDIYAANLPRAEAWLASLDDISYSDFLKIHEMLFVDFYPWAGQDRVKTAPSIAISKAGIFFSHPGSARLAVEEALRIGQDVERMRASPGLVMGLFAYGHPFLDGNGRTMMTVHAELCFRAGFSIDWHLTDKSIYLARLSDEITTPGKGILDRYLSSFIRARKVRRDWINDISTINGLDGLGSEDSIEGNFSDLSVSKKYEDFDRQRGYDATSVTGGELPICSACKTNPCVCERAR